MKIRFLFLALVFQASQLLHNAEIQGNVVDQRTGETLSGVNVELLLASGAVAKLAVSDGQGNFSFPEVPPGQYRLVATKAGYVRGEYGRRKLDGPGLVLTLEAGNRLSGLRFTLSPTASIEGRVFDRAGRLVLGASVDALQAAYKDGRRELRLVQRMVTNDLGEYRFFWLPPGQYYVSAALPRTELETAGVGSILVINPASTTRSVDSPRSPSRGIPIIPGGDVEIFPPFYFPGTTEVHRAEPINATGGETRRGIDIVAAGFRAINIRGSVVISESGQPAVAEVILTPTTAITSSKAPNGLFEFKGLVPGSYTLVARSTNGTEQLFGRTKVEVNNQDIVDLKVEITRGAHIVGRVVWDGQMDADLSIRIILNPEPLLNLGSLVFPTAIVRGQGRFVLENVMSGDYRMKIITIPPPTNQPPNVYTKSITVGAKDILNGTLRVEGRIEEEMQVVLANDGGMIEGVVIDQNAQPVANATVVLLPDALLRSRSDLYRVTTTDNRGQFRIAGIAPGSYKVFADEVIEEGAWQDPAFVALHEHHSQGIQVGPRDKQKIQLAMPDLN